MSATVCTATTPPLRASMGERRAGVAPITCVRDVEPDGRHRGNHQGWEHMPAYPGNANPPIPPRPASDSLVTWGDGGASGGAALKPGQTYGTCTDCGVLYAPGSHFDMVDGLCFTCGLWSHRIADYRNPGHADQVTRRRTPRRPAWSRFVRPHDATSGAGAWLYGWVAGSVGAFGGREAIVTWDDGVTAGPASSLWSSGRIPWWLEDQFPPNGSIEWADGVRIPGHTTWVSGAGQPLVYTGHPALPEVAP